MKFKIVEKWKNPGKPPGDPVDFTVIDISAPNRFCSVKAAEKFMNKSPLDNLIFSLIEETSLTKLRGWGFIYEAIPE